MTELKPCPFCGKQVEMHITAGADAGNDEYYVGCGCLSNEAGAYGLECDGDTEQSVADQWNNRPIEDALRARISELEAEIEALGAEFDLVSHDLDGIDSGLDRIRDEFAEVAAAALKWATYDGLEEASLPEFGRLVLLNYSPDYYNPPEDFWTVAKLIYHNDSYYNNRIAWNLTPYKEIPTLLLPSGGHRWAYLPTLEASK